MLSAERATFAKAKTQGSVDGNAYANTRTDPNAFRVSAMLELDSPAERQPGHRAIDAERKRKVARSGAKSIVPDSGSAFAHLIDSRGWLQRPQQDGFAPSFRPRHKVHAPMDAIASVYIDMSAREKHRQVPALGATMRMARRIILRISLHFDDPAPDALYEKEHPKNQRSGFGCGKAQDSFYFGVHTVRNRNFIQGGASSQ